MSYHLFTIDDERESILIYRTKDLNFSQIGKLLHRHPSGISREWKRHTKENSYSPNKAQASYKLAKSHCGRKRKLDLDSNLSKIVKHLFLDCQWSPEEIEGRLCLEYGKSVISYQTIYRAIYRGHFDDKLSHGARGAIRKPRYRGKIRHTQGHVENRGRISISHTIHERPEDANNLIKVIERNAFGFWNFDNFKTRILIALNIKKERTKFVLSRS